MNTENTFKWSATAAENNEIRKGRQSFYDLYKKDGSFVKRSNDISFPEYSSQIKKGDYYVCVGSSSCSEKNPYTGKPW